MKLIWGRGAARFAWLSVLLALLIAACGDEVRTKKGKTGDDDDDDDDVTPPTLVNKLDLLLVIDNSRSMADKQELLKLAVPDMLDQLLNPPCVDASGVTTAQQPTDPLQDCPEGGSSREHAPLLDVHIGIVTSSIGGHGADACSGAANESEDDHGRLINRSSTDGSTPPVATYQDRGYLVWDPDPSAPSHSPPGETDMNILMANLTTMVGGAGEVGCGYEAPLEAWYRFLVDPDPYAAITLENDSAVLQGTDQVLLQQRKDFLRSDSLLAILLLSDENDCSVRDGGQFYFSAQIYQLGTNNPYHLPKPRAACASDPNSDCCRSCGQKPGVGCDASGDDCGSPNALSALDDNINLRCYDQKRRFGIDFLWPIERYTAGLSVPQLADRHGNVVSNPLFTDLDPNDNVSAVRDATMVVLAGIIGVPWQDLARRNSDGAPDLIGGLNQNNEPVGGFQSAEELVFNGTWDLILGDPSCYHTDPGCLPFDPLMIESVDARSGANPVTGAPLITSSSPLGNGINGHEYAIPQRDDLQYACVFDLPTPRDCTAVESCDCNDPNNDNPLCFDGAAFGQTQYRAKAYPGMRQLSVLEAIQTQAVVTSICPEQQVDATLFNYGYRPAVKALVERINQNVAVP